MDERPHPQVRRDRGGGGPKHGLPSPAAAAEAFPAEGRGLSVGPCAEGEMQTKPEKKEQKEQGKMFALLMRTSCGCL